MSLAQRHSQSLSLAFSWKDISFMTVILIALNLLDVGTTFYAVGVLGFSELNPLAVGFPIWIFALKFGICFIPALYAYVLEKLSKQKYLLLPFIFSVILVEFYAFVVAFNVGNILGV